MSKKITFRLPKDMHTILIRLAKERKVPISGLIREIISDSENIICYLQDQANILENEIQQLRGMIEKKNEEIQQLKSRLKNEYHNNSCTKVPLKIPT